MKEVAQRREQPIGGTLSTGVDRRLGLHMPSMTETRSLANACMAG